jgi:hypothetical protein
VRGGGIGKSNKNKKTGDASTGAGALALETLYHIPLHCNNGQSIPGLLVEEPDHRQQKGMHTHRQLIRNGRLMKRRARRLLQQQQKIYTRAYLTSYPRKLTKFKL